MDSNGTRFLLLNSGTDFRTADRDCGWDVQGQAFTLARHDPPRMPRMAVAEALALAAAASPWVLDDHGQLARLSDDRKHVEFTLSWPAATWEVLKASRDPRAPLASSLDELLLDPVDAPEGCIFLDLHLGGSGVIAAPYSDGGGTHGLVLVHLRYRWQASCTLPFAARRAWVDGEDSIWLAGETQLGLARGAPLLQAYTPRPDRFEPEAVEPDPLRFLWSQPLPGHRGLMGLAADAERLLLLVQDVDGSDEAPRQAIFSRPLDPAPSAAFARHLLPADLPLAVDIAAQDGRAILLPPLPPDSSDAARHGPRDCPVLSLEVPARLLLERWPRNSEAGHRFVRHRDNEVRYLSAEGVQRLYRLAQARFLPEGSASLLTPLDSGDPGTVWDSLYLEASIPAGCRLRVSAFASDERDAPAIGHFELQPEPLWSPLPSELPFASSRARSIPGREGLFEILLQRAGGAARALRGRYLRLRFTLSGDGRHTPAIFALRAWYPRFSWQSHYLPDHFHQQASPADPLVSDPAPANGADLRERLLASFEGVLTPIEDRIAASEVLLYPDAVPSAFLPQLAAMLGTTLRAHWPESRQRRWLAALGHLQRRKGTFGGLVQALDILTDGAVARGQVVPVELFRLRRSLATVLGVSMDDARHPLTLGTGQSGNSIVGDSLILSEDQSLEVLALFAPEAARPGLEQEAVARFFDSHARRLSIVLHGPARTLAGVIEEALPELVPAVIQWNIIKTEHPFVLGLSPLLQIDTYLETQPPFGRVRLDRSRLGRGDLIQNPVALSPENAMAVAPTDTQGDWA